MAEQQTAGAVPNFIPSPTLRNLLLTTGKMSPAWAQAIGALEGAGKPILPATTRFAPIPPENTFEPAQTQFGATGAIAPSSQAKLAALPAFLGGGRYVIDPQNPGKLIKSSRNTNPDLTAFLRGGLPSRLYEVDHIMPLWAGGDNTAQNKTVLTKPDHGRKSKVEAVVRQLYYSGKMSLREAQSELTTWQDKDINGIQLDEGGDLVAKDKTKAAEEKYKEWKSPPKVTLKGWWEALKAGTPGVAGEFAQATASGITGGWIPGGQYTYQDPEEQKQVEIARKVGVGVGTIMGFIGLGALVRGVASATGVSTMVKSSSLGKKLFNPEAMMTVRGIQIPGQSLLKAVEAAGLFGLQDIYAKHEQEDFSGRVGSFLSAVTLGGVVGGAGQSLKGFAGVAGATYMLSFMEGGDVEDSILSSAIMVGLHGLNFPQYKRAVNNIEKAATEKAIDFRTKYLTPEGLPPEGIGAFVKQKTAEWTRPKFSTDLEIKMGEENKIIFDRIFDSFQAGRIDAARVEQDIYSTVLSGRHLYKQNESVYSRLRDDLYDIMGVGEKLKEPANSTKISLEKFSVPRNAIAVAEKYPDLVALESPRITDLPALKHEAPSGTIQLTGVADFIDPKTTLNTREFINAIGEGQVRRGPGLGKPRILLLKSDLSWLLERVNQRMDVNAVTRGEAKPYGSPQKNVQAVGYVEGKGLLNLGFIPREWRIEDGPNSLNKNIRRMNFKKQGDENLGIPPFDAKTMNKNSIYDAMVRNKVDFVEAEVVKYGLAGEESGQPYVIIETTPQLWQEAVAQVKGEAIKIAEPPRAAAEYISKIELQGPQPSSIKEVGQAKVAELTSKIESFLAQAKASDNPAMLESDLNRTIGKVVDTKEAKDIVDGVKPVRINTIINWFDKAAKNGSITTEGAEYYKLLESFYRSLSTVNKGKFESVRLRAIEPEPIVTGEIPQKIGLQEAAAQQFPQLIRTGEQAGKRTIVTGKGKQEVFVTRAGAKLGKEVLSDGSYWLEQNIKKAGGKWTPVAQAGHKVEHLMLPDNGGYAGKIRIDGAVYTYPEAEMIYLGKNGLVAAKQEYKNLLTKRAEQPSKFTATDSKKMAEAKRKYLSLSDLAEQQKGNVGSMAPTPESVRLSDISNQAMKETLAPEPGSLPDKFDKFSKMIKGEGDKRRAQDIADAIERDNAINENPVTWGDQVLGEMSTEGNKLYNKAPLRIKTMVDNILVEGDAIRSAGKIKKGSKGFEAMLTRWENIRQGTTAGSDRFQVQTPETRIRMGKTKEQNPVNYEGATTINTLDRIMLEQDVKGIIKQFPELDNYRDEIADYLVLISRGQRGTEKAQNIENAVNDMLKKEGLEDMTLEELLKQADILLGEVPTTPTAFSQRGAQQRLALPETGILDKYYNLGKVAREPQFNTIATQLMNSGNTATDPKVKLFWKTVVDVLNKKFKGWYQPSKNVDQRALMAKQTSEYQEGSKMAGREKTIDARTWELEKAVKTQRFADLPAEIQTIIYNKQAQYPGVKIISSPADVSYNPATHYNIYRDLYKYTHGTEPEAYFPDMEQKAIREHEKKNLQSIAQVSAEEVFSLGTVPVKTEQQINETIISSVFHKVLGPMEDIAKLNDVGIKAVAEDFAQLLGRVIK
ncbi:hypothetical protein [Candidatus Magnetobacterium casense]|uniref:HNH nuclease domain-containing protein n=1 Tax=Candidatus Magnetobacterium casense TaxID=1455061 RepID=A0ABS6RU09_9BACT|nr:hypothetical protein [Candidatus Magnetobacterium casensis]MBV6340115.1 hypothetical protein [Candidatus Magnetobacterium casensis]